jgi:hypothetical protein
LSAKTQNNVKEEKMCVTKKIIPGIILVIMALSMASGCLFGEVVAGLEGVLKPETIYVDSDRLYLIENFSVFIYSLEDYRLIKKFGRKGEGPREFNSFLRINVHKDKLFINSRMKLSIYSKKGEFISEMRPGSNSWMFKPLGNHYVGYAPKMEDKKGYSTLNLYDHQLKKQKELICKPYPFRRGGRINPLTALRRPPFYISSGLVFIEGVKEGVIECFDIEGNRVRSITPAIKPTKCTAEREKELRRFFASDHRFKGVWEEVKSRIVFSKHYPLFKHFAVVDGAIYVVTYKQSAGTHDFECFVLDLKGNPVKHTHVTILNNSVFEGDEFPYCIKDGKLFQVVENPDDEEIQLHVTPI